jgi:hypothetical protein
MYLVDHPVAIQTPPNFYDTVSITICQRWEKSGKTKDNYLKPKKSKQLTVLMRFSGLSIQCFISFLNLNNPTTAKINFDVTEI